MLERDFPEIRALPLFAGIAADSFEALMRGAYLQTFPPQIDLIREGDPSDFLHVVTEGAVEMFASWSGRDTVIQTVRPVSTFILAATIRDAPYLMSARTISRSRLVLIPSQDVRDVFEADPAFARAVVMDLAQCYRSVVKHTKDLKLRNSIERLANYLLRQRKAAGDAAAFQLPVEKRRLAAFLGMTPENLSRAFRSLEAYGVVTDGASVRINDPSDLVGFARPTPLIDDGDL
ncbi:MAG: helix-turn-helix domain-containing protein [Paracoccaceae bacterium]|nr:helix-turn-helix domain-containing protein [Paracoccaceae bacterium]MDE3122710.1 helix-turn-helix domain-containing protein [Paracoccaceae bacterium]MDE3239270.1 helix-turn-helix domain-containing protein [Paracoccaceae bacterium]